MCKVGILCSQWIIMDLVRARMLSVVVQAGNSLGVCGEGNVVRERGSPRGLNMEGK